MTRSALLRSRLAPLALTVALVVAVTGCDSTGPSASGGGEVQVGFSTSSSTSTSSTNALAKAESDSLVLSGANGDTLNIHDIRLIVDKVKLEQDGEDQDGDDDGNDSTEVEIEREVEVERPSFLDLPLQGSEISPVAAGDVPEGTYNEFEFEVDDLDDDEGQRPSPAVGNPGRRRIPELARGRKHGRRRHLHARRRHTDLLHNVLRSRN